MRVDKHIRNQLRLQSGSFYILFALLAVLLAYLSHRHSIEWDWTASQRNTLSAASANLLASLNKPLSFVVYATDSDTVRAPIADLIKRYQRTDAKIDVQWINPELEPALVRELGIHEDGAVMIHYGERSEKVTQADETTYSNAIQRLARGEDRWLVFLTGHGERNPLGQANYDLGEWGKQLVSKGIKVQPLNLSEQARIPDNAAALVIASPQVDLLSGEVQIISDYLDHGGNLLWLADPGSLHHLQPLAKQLDLKFLPGTIIDANTRLLGINDPRMAIVNQYPPNELTRNFDVLTLFPQARALFLNERLNKSLNESSNKSVNNGLNKSENKSPDGTADTKTWQTKPFLLSSPRSWLETGSLSGEINFDKDTDVKGPLVIGLTFTRQIPTPNPVQASAEQNEANSGGEQLAGEQHAGELYAVEQRVVVVGDGDFLSNTYLGNVGNMDLGLHIANWLSRDDQLISIPAKSAADTSLQLPESIQLLIAFGFLIFLPLAMAAGGFGIWWQRRKR